MATESVTERSARIRKERIAALRKKRMSAQARAAAAKPNTPRIIKAKAAQNASREKTKSRVASAMKSLGNINAKGLRNARDDAEGVLVSNVPRADRQQRLKGIKKAAKAGTLAQSPDVYIPPTSAKKGLLAGGTSQRGNMIGGTPRSGNMIGDTPPPRGAENPDVLKVANLLKNTPRGSDAPITRSTSGTGTRKAQPRSRPNPPRRPTVGGDMMGTTPPGGGTLSKKDVDEYSEAFASPDADKMYKLSEKNRRTDMNMLERAFDSIKVAGDRATADRKKRGLSNYDMNEDVFGSRLGGGIKNTMNNKQPSTRKRAAQRGFGVETRGN